VRDRSIEEVETVTKEPSELPDPILLRVIDELRRRRPGAPLSGTGIRPRRRPWTYRDLERLLALEEEARRRGLVAPTDGDRSESG
jgi:hypothetical protein